jgi:2-keto-4-pentenoate hydratase/2-oxohepta-3-ene-1,7-dioic acid hydratase in catechol pathway
MRLCRFDHERLGVVEGESVRDVTSVLADLPACRYPLPRFDLLIANLPDLRRRIDAVLPDAAEHALSAVTLLSPVANPGKIVAAPVNYSAHLEEARADAQVHHQNQIGEIQRVGLFLKATSSLIGPAEGVTLRSPQRRNDHEIELVAVIGKGGRDIPTAAALSHVAGYCIGLDMTLRGPEERSLRKSIDSYSVLGPWMVTADELRDPSSLDLELTVNGQPRQRASTRDLILGVSELIAFASSFYTLQPGDLLFTGTPQGVAPVQPGDRMVAEIARIGRMVVDVRAAATQPPGG